MADAIDSPTMWRTWHALSVALERLDEARPRYSWVVAHRAVETGQVEECLRPDPRFQRWRTAPARTRENPWCVAHNPEDAVRIRSPLPRRMALEGVPKDRYSPCPEGSDAGHRGSGPLLIALWRSYFQRQRWLSQIDRSRVSSADRDQLVEGIPGQFAVNDGGDLQLV